MEVPHLPECQHRRGHRLACCAVWMREFSQAVVHMTTPRMRLLPGAQHRRPSAGEWGARFRIRQELRRIRDPPQPWLVLSDAFAVVDAAFCPSVTWHVKKSTAGGLIEGDSSKPITKNW